MVLKVAANVSFQSLSGFKWPTYVQVVLHIDSVSMFSQDSIYWHMKLIMFQIISLQPPVFLCRPGIC